MIAWLLPFNWAFEKILIISVWIFTISSFKGVVSLVLQEHMFDNEVIIFSAQIPLMSVAVKLIVLCDLFCRVYMVRIKGESNTATVA